MAMEYKTRQVGSVTVLDIIGRISLGEAIAFGPGSGTSLQNIVKECARRGQKNIVLNLTDVSYIDSSGIGELVGSATTLRKDGGDLIVVNPNDVVQQLMRITRLETVIQVKRDEPSAIEAFRSKGATAA